MIQLLMRAGALGWNEDASDAAVRQCNGNVTAAVEMLEREEVAMLDQFESAVKDMVRGYQSQDHFIHYFRFIDSHVTLSYFTYVPICSVLSACHTSSTYAHTSVSYS